MNVESGRDTQEEEEIRKIITKFDKSKDVQEKANSKAAVSTEAVLQPHEPTAKAALKSQKAELKHLSPRLKYVFCGKEVLQASHFKQFSCT